MLVYLSVLLTHRQDLHPSPGRLELVLPLVVSSPSDKGNYDAYTIMIHNDAKFQI